MLTWSKTSRSGGTDVQRGFSWLQTLVGITTRSSPLGIVVDDERRVFANVIEFELSLKKRTQCPSERAGEFCNRSSMQLGGSIRDCQRLIVKVDEGLRRLEGKSHEINELLKSAQLPRGARDHGWGYILHTLGGYGPAFDLYKVAALTKFRLYLKSVKIALANALIEASPPEGSRFVQPNSKKLAAAVSVPAFVTRVPPQCVA